MVQGELALLLATHLVLTALPGLAVALFIASRGERRVPILLAVFLAASAGAAMIGFWAYYWEQEVGLTWSYLVTFGSALAVAWLLYDRKIGGEVLRGLGTPLGLWVLGTAFLVFLAFMLGNIHNSVPVSGNRFSGPLPSDNYIPYFYSRWFYANGHTGTPPEFSGNWLASDRPPLQIGYVLTQRPFHINGNELNYVSLGVCLQQLWIVGLWALLSALPVGKLTRALTMLTVLVSGLVLVNGFFVWPKLLPAAMLLAATALLLTPLWDEVRSRLWGGALIAALFGLAMMGHGSSVFAIIGIAIFAAFRGLPSWRWIGVAVAMLILVMAPWSAYQKWGDPPGNRLTKWYLGGDQEPDEKSVTEAISDGYGEAGIGGTLHHKGQNFVAIFGGKSMVENLETAFKFESFEATVVPLRTIIFFNLVPSLGLLLLGPVAMAIGWRRRGRHPLEYGAALTLLGAFALCTLVWALIMFGGSVAQTVIHQGSYLVPILGIAACTIGLRAVWPRFSIWWLALNLIVVLVLYVPYFEPYEGSVFSLANVLLAAVFLVGFGALALGRRSDLQVSG